MQILKYAIILFISLSLTSCGRGSDKKVDTTAPSITLKNPTLSTIITPGGILKVNMILGDDVKLKTYMVSIEPGGTKSMKNIEEFSFNSHTDLDAHGKPLPNIAGKKTAEVNFDILISEKARFGNYTFSLSAEDQSGNTANKTVPFEIVRP